MKKIVVIVLIGVCLCLFIPIQSNVDKSEYLRLHIRANSNLEIDQSVKYKVKVAIVDFLEDKITKTQNKAEAINVINENVENIENVADFVLAKSGMNYTSSAQIKKEFFPTRTYENLTLENGWYDALIVNLGAGKGDNWWCVVYPPVCFVGAKENGTGKIRYKSLFKQLFDNILQ